MTEAKDQKKYIQPFPQYFNAVTLPPSLQTTIWLENKKLSTDAKPKGFQDNRHNPGLFQANQKV